MRQTARQSPCRTRIRSSCPRNGRRAECTAKGSAATASTPKKTAPADRAPAMRRGSSPRLALRSVVGRGGVNDRPPLTSDGKVGHPARFRNRYSPSGPPLSRFAIPAEGRETMSAMGTGRSLSSGRPKAGPGGRRGNGFGTSWTRDLPTRITPALLPSGVAITEIKKPRKRWNRSSAPAIIPTGCGRIGRIRRRAWKSEPAPYRSIRRTGSIASIAMPSIRSSCSTATAIFCRPGAPGCSNSRMRSASTPRIVSG